MGKTEGLPASPGQVLGRVCLSTFKRDMPRGEFLPPVLFLASATPDDLHDIDAAAASAGSVGGLTSHLAVICRGMRKPCVVGTEIGIDKDLFRMVSFVVVDGRSPGKKQDEMNATKKVIQPVDLSNVLRTGTGIKVNLIKVSDRAKIKAH